MLQTEMWRARSISGVGGKSLLGLGDVDWGQIVSAAVSAGAAVYATWSAHDLGVEANRLRRDELNFAKAQAIEQLAFMKQQYEDQQALAKTSVFGVPTNFLYVVGGGILLAILLISRRR